VQKEVKNIYELLQLHWDRVFFTAFVTLSAAIAVKKRSLLMAKRMEPALAFEYEVHLVSYLRYYPLWTLKALMFSSRILESLLEE
jgi:hypothetical protein